MAAPLVPTLPAYLPLPAPHADLCLTTFLPTDAADQVRLFGDPRVYLFLVGPPFPYTPEMADGWVGGEQARWADGSVWPAPSGELRFLRAVACRSPLPPGGTR